MNLGSGGPYFAACWRRDRVWASEDFRLFSRARERVGEEMQSGAELGYVEHIATREAVWVWIDVDEVGILRRPATRPLEEP